MFNLYAKSLELKAKTLREERERKERQYQKKFELWDKTETKKSDVFRQWTESEEYKTIWDEWTQAQKDGKEPEEIKKMWQKNIDLLQKILRENGGFMNEKGEIFLP